MSPFDFESVEAFTKSADSTAPAGNYHMKVVEARDDLSSGGHPMIFLKLESDHGAQWDRLVITDAEFSRRKVAGLFKAAGVEIKNDMFSDKGHCKQEVLDKDILGKTVGTIVRDEDDNRPDHYGESRPKVQGYNLVDLVQSPGPLAQTSLKPPGFNGGDVPIDTEGLPQPADNESVPF